MTPSRADQLMAEYLEMILEPGVEMDLEAIFTSPESQEIRREGEARMRVDWAYLGRYRDANAQRAGEAAPTLVMLGDSITENWGPADPELFADGIVNRGIGGQIAAQLLVRFTPDVVRLRPRAVHVMVGTNDIGGNHGTITDEDYQGHVTAMLDLAEAHGIRVILGSIPPCSTFGWNPGLDPVPVIARWNSWLRDIAVERGAVFADYGPALAGASGGLDPELGNDGVHPNRRGYAAMRPILEDAVRALGLD